MPKYLDVSLSTIIITLYPHSVTFTILSHFLSNISFSQHRPSLHLENSSMLLARHLSSLEWIILSNVYTWSTQLRIDTKHAFPRWFYLLAALPSFLYRSKYYILFSLRSSVALLIYNSLYQSCLLSWRGLLLIFLSTSLVFIRFL